MKKKKWIWATGALLLIILLLSFGFRSLTPYFSAKALTEEEASNVVLEKYPGEIVKMVKINSEYLIDIQLKTGVYFIKIDAKTGDILSLELLKKEEQVTPPPVPTEIETTQEPIPKAPDTNKIITEQEAIVIATDHIKGIVDDDVEFYHPSGKTPYYLVEVEIETEKKDREATVQIDAYTGTIKSVNWDD